MPVQTGMDKTGATARTLQHTARACMEAIGEGLQAETVKVGAPHSTGRHDGQVPAVVLNGGQGGDRTAALCAMVGCATQAQWRQHPVDCTDFGCSVLVVRDDVCRLPALRPGPYYLCV